ncbi:McrB family protein [Leyella stercorea]|uniref:McrB family protein n=1 Tax=Leyella stercorea TaxID=363265 RepID=UPI003A91EBBE
MKLQHLLELINELSPNTYFKYIRSDEQCEYIKIDMSEPRVYSQTPDGKNHSIADTYLQVLAERIEENVPFNISQLMNNSGSNRPIIETIIAHTKEFYWYQNGRAKYVVWIPTKPHIPGELKEWTDSSIIQTTSIKPIVKTIDELIVNDLSSHLFSEQELGDILKSMYKAGNNNHSQVAGIHLFGLKYGQNIRANKLSVKNIVSRAGLSDNYIVEINKGVKLSELISQNSFGMAFWNGETKVKKKSEFSNLIINSAQGYYLQYLTAIRTKSFMLLAGISGTGKSRIVRKLAQATVTEELQKAEGYKGTDFANDRWTLHSPANFELIQVKPNWHNSMDVIGYLSNIPSPHYVFTPFIEFIVKAWQHPKVPFFLCLDEMNLAPVEEYFAEFLSAIESRSFEGEEYLTDPIIKPFNSFGTTKDENGVDISIGDMMIDTLFPKVKASNTNSELLKIKEHFQTKGLTLPKNLIVIGTVNMDETTFSFSRKVLDRAMSVEMNEVNYDSFLTDTTDDDLKAVVKALEENDDADLNELLVDRHIEAREIIDELGEDAKFTIDYLKRINALLEGTPFKLGYRAANEALIYLQASKEFRQTDRTAALDNFTLMKILSRIEGDETKLKITDSEADKERIANAGVNVDTAKRYGDLNILTALRNIITEQLGETINTDVDSDATEETATENDDEMVSTEQNKKDLLSVKKIDSMLSQLKRDHFVSFWN